MSSPVTQPRTSAPDWLERLRSDARKDYETAAPPPNSSEVWRRTPYSMLGLDGSFESVRCPGADLEQAGFAAAAAPAFKAVAGLSAHFHKDDGRAPYIEVKAELEAKGLKLMTLEAAAKALPELVRPQLEALWGDAENRKLELLNRGGFSHGAFLYIPRGLSLAEPVRVAFNRSEAGHVYPRLLVIADDGAEFTLIEEHHSGEGAHASVAFSRVVLGKNVRASLIYQQELGPEARHYFSQRVTVGEGAQLTHSSLVLGGKLAKSHLSVDMAGPRSRAELFGMTLGNGAQHFDSYTHQWHQVPKTTSDLMFRSVLRDRSRSVYNGLIRIEKEAVETEAYQANNNLLLSDKARADSTPILEILTDEVRCKHGATAGPLNKEELFYLLTRGFDPEQAQKALIMGFFEPVLKRLPLAGERVRLAAQIEGRL